jgi:hypothetical protein
MHTPAANDGAAYPKIYRSLMVVGLLGIVRGLREDADIVNAAVEMTLVDARPFRLFKALAQGMGGHADDAREALEQHMRQYPEDAQAQVVLGAVLMRLGHSGGRSMLDNVLSTSVDQTARKAAQDLLDVSTA